MILVNNLSRSKIDTGKVKFKASKILKLLGIFSVEGRFAASNAAGGNFERKRKVDPGLGRWINNWYLEVNLVPPRKMAELHKKFLKKSGPTTVISLELGGNFPVGNFSGGGVIYLCLSEIKKSGLPLEYFLLHGILHLCGFDHKTKKQEKEMLEKERQICDKMR